MQSSLQIPGATQLQISANFVRNLLLRRHLIFNFVVRDLKMRYVGSFMGFFWAVIHPLVLLVSYTFVFSVIFQVRLPEALPDNFPIFLFCGILPWLYFQDTLQRSATCVIDHANLIKKTLFPSEILPVVLALSNLITHLVGFSILLIALAFLGTLSWVVVVLPVYFLLMAILALGLSWLVAALQVFLRDTAQVLSILLVLWFWFTPIFYQVDLVPSAYQRLIGTNPMSYVVQAYRDVLLLGRLPSLESLLWLAAFAAAALLVGGAFFRNTKREFVDVL